MVHSLGLSLPQTKQYKLGRDVPAVARAAEEIGYESLWVFERILFSEPVRQGLGRYGEPDLPWADQYRSVADPLVTLALAAAVTERARLGSSVLVAPLHAPFQLARTLASLDAASGGRVVAGLGTGYSPEEYAAAAVTPFEKRGRALDEVLDVCQAVWGPNPVSYEGEFTTIAPSEVNPKPARPIPVLLAASNPPSMRRVVDRADGWLPVAIGVDHIGAAWRQLRDMAAERGRTRPIHTVLRVNALYASKPYDGKDREPFQGSVEQIVTDLAPYAEVGFEEILLDLRATTRDGEELKDVAAQVYAAARTAGL